MYQVKDKTDLLGLILVSSMAFSYRRPSVLRYQSWVDACIRVLQAAPAISLNDSRLIEWTKLQIIAEECMSAAGLDDESNVCLADDRVRRVLKLGIERVVSWKQQVSPEVIHRKATHSETTELFEVCSLTIRRTDNNPLLHGADQPPRAGLLRGA